MPDHAASRTSARRNHDHMGRRGCTVRRTDHPAAGRARRHRIASDLPHRTVAPSQAATNRPRPDIPGSAAVRSAHLSRLRRPTTHRHETLPGVPPGHEHAPASDAAGDRERAAPPDWRPSLKASRGARSDRQGATRPVGQPPGRIAGRVHRDAIRVPAAHTSTTRRSRTTRSCS
jgi:hypothetical protein